MYCILFWDLLDKIFDHALIKFLRFFHNQDTGPTWKEY